MRKALERRKEITLQERGKAGKDERIEKTFG
jgi:hypothetical protein